MAETVDKGLLSCDWRVLASLTAVAVIALYYYLTSKFNYWKKRGFPEVDGTPIPLFGHTYKLATGQRNFIDMFDELYKASGSKPYVGFFQGTQPCLLVNDLDLIKNIFIKDFHMFMDRAFEADEEIDPLNAKSLFNLTGQRWKEMRARLSPTFTSGRMKAMFPLMKACSKELLQLLRTDTEKNNGEAILEIKVIMDSLKSQIGKPLTRAKKSKLERKNLPTDEECMACFTTDVIATCAFGIRCDALQNQETSEFRKMGKVLLEPTFKRSISLLIFLLAPKLIKLLGLKFSDERTSVFFRKLVKDVVEQREEAIDKNEDGEKGFGDFIHQLALMKKRGLHPRDTKEDSDSEDGDQNDINQTEKESNKVEPSWSNVTLDDLTAQAIVFFTAGFETTSSLLSFALFELASSERGLAIQKELRDEVDRVMKEHEGQITYEGLKKMHLLDRVLKEALRIYPPAGLLNRKTLQSYKIPGTNHHLDKGTAVFIATQSIQRDERYFPNPMTFDPDRFLPEHKEKWNQFAYLPFGDGPRVCIGQRFAEMQSRLGLAALISEFEIRLCSEKTSVPLRFNKRAFMLTTETGIWLRIKPRSDKL